MKPILIALVTVTLSLALSAATHAMQPGGSSGTSGKKTKNAKPKKSAGDRLTLNRRPYYLHVPDAWQKHVETTSAEDDAKPGAPRPPVLIVWLHPSDGNAQPEFKWLRAHKRQMADHVILAPQSAGRGWFVSKDAPHVDQVLKKTIDDLRLDPDRVILGGHSAGGMFTYMYAMTRQDKFFMLVPAAARIHTRFVRITPADCNAPYFHLYHSKNDRVVPMKYANEAVNLLTKAGYRVDLTEDKANHNVTTKTVNILADGADYLNRTYLPDDVDEKIKTLLGGDDALTTLWQADTYELKINAAADGKDAGLRRMRNVLDILHDPATFDFDGEPRGQFIPGRTLIATKGDATVTIQFSTAFDRLRVVTGTTETPGDLEAAKVIAIASSAKTLMRRWIVPMNCK